MLIIRIYHDFIEIHSTVWLFFIIFRTTFFLFIFSRSPLSVGIDHY